MVERRAQGRRQLLAIVAVAAASVAGSFLLFDAARESGVWATTNHGRFVEPPQRAGELGLRDRNGAPLADGTWWLWVRTGAGCGADCEAALHQLRQLHVLLNKDAGRVRRALIADLDEAAAVGLTERYPRLELLSGESTELESGIYIVDPLGNLVLWYPLADAGKPVLEDLKRLLKVSQIG